MNDNCNGTLQNHVSAQPRYGIDAPGFIQGFFLVGISAFIAGFFIPGFNLFGIRVAILGPLLCFTALIPLALGTSMAIYGLRGKFNIRDLMLNMIAWRGDEQVLDIGTGRGLLVIGAAKCLSTGKAIGIDIWRAQDLSGNTMENTLRNIALEGMQGKVELKKEDIRSTSFADKSSSLCLKKLLAPVRWKSKSRNASLGDSLSGMYATITAFWSKFARPCHEEPENLNQDYLHPFAPQLLQPRRLPYGSCHALRKSALACAYAVPRVRETRLLSLSHRNAL